MADGAPVVNQVTPATSEQDYISMLQNATTLAQLRAGLVPWARFIPQTLQLVNWMSVADFKVFRAGLLEILAHPEGEGEPTQQFMQKYGQLMTPDPLTDASKKAEQHNTTLGVVLLAIWPN